MACSRVNFTVENVVSLYNHQNKARGRTTGAKPGTHFGMHQYTVSSYTQNQPQLEQQRGTETTSNYRYNPEVG